MNKTNNYNDKLLKTLIDGVKPALGCTEPVAVGLAAAKAYEDVKGDIESVTVKVSPNIYKNGMGVGIPGTKEIGLVFAAALGITCGDPNLGFEVFRPVNNKAVAEAETLVKNNQVSVDLEDTKGNFYIEAKVITDKGKGICIIKNSHTNIVYVEANGKVLFEKEEEEKSNSNDNEYLKYITLKDIRNFVENISYQDIDFYLKVLN